MRDIFDPDLKFGFDIDGVLTHTFVPLVEVCKERGILPDDFDPKNEVLSDHTEGEGPKGHINLTGDEAADIFSEEFFSALPPREGVDDLRHWIECGMKVKFITARYDSTKDVTLDWLDRYGLLRREDDLIFCRTSKKHCIVDGFCFFVDDTPEVIHSMEGIVPHRFILECPTNTWYDGELRATWSDVRRHIEGVKWRPWRSS